MPRFTNPLDQINVAAPCRADWDGMVGDERVRFCQQCERHVYNLSGMTRKEAENLVTNAEGRLCVRFYRRRDGTVLTANCPVGLRSRTQRVARAARALVSAGLGFLAGLGVSPGPPARWIRIVGADELAPPFAAPPPHDVPADRGMVVGQLAYSIRPQEERGRARVRRGSRRR